MISMRNIPIVQHIIPLKLVMVIVKVTITMQSVDMMEVIAMISMRNIPIVQPIIPLVLEMESVNVS